MMDEYAQLRIFQDRERARLGFGPSQEHVRRINLMRLQTDIAKVRRERARWREVGK